MSEIIYPLEFVDYTEDQMRRNIVTLGLNIYDHLVPIWYNEWTTYEEGGFSFIFTDDVFYYLLEWSSSVYSSVNDPNEAELQVVSEDEALNHMISYEEMVENMPDCSI